MSKKQTLESKDRPISTRTISESILLDQLDKWTIACEKQAEAMRAAGMKEIAIGSEAMATAYWAVKQFVEINSN